MLVRSLSSVREWFDVPSVSGLCAVRRNKACQHRHVLLLKGIMQQVLLHLEGRCSQKYRTDLKEDSTVGFRDLESLCAAQI